jgi:hypothetical protein
MERMHMLTLLIGALVWLVATLAAVVRICTAPFSERVRNQIFRHPAVHALWFGVVILGIVLSHRSDLWLITRINTGTPNKTPEHIYEGRERPSENAQR